MQEVTLQQVLDARDRRAAEQKKLLKTYKTPLLCFTMNIAGPVKTCALIERAFFEGIRLLEERVDKPCILHRAIEVEVTGCQAMFCISMDAAKLKAVCTDMEERFPLGRLFDMDVIAPDGTKLSRKTERGCLVCGAPGRACAAGRLHTVPQLWQATNKIMSDYFFLSDQSTFAHLATESLLDEVHTTPKPGLVDRRNSGSHSDMDLDSFIRSAHALTPYFKECFAIGHKSAGQVPNETFQALRAAGLCAEKAMFRATGGVNTHKGAIYSMGVLCGALGRLWSADLPIPSLEVLLSLCSEMTGDALREDFLTPDTSTAGKRLYHQYGLTGIRGEVAAGFPSVSKCALPVLRKKISEGLSENDAAALTLLHLIATVQDTNLYHRGGVEGARFAADRAKALLQNTTPPTRKQIELLDDDFIAKNLSPGGSADLLAVTYFLFRLTSKNPLR